MRFYLVVLLTVLLGALPASGQQVPKGFAPCHAASIAATSPSSNTQLSKCGPSVILMNLGTQEAFYNVGQTAATVASAGTYSLPGGDFILLVVQNQTAAGWYVAGFTSTSRRQFGCSRAPRNNGQGQT